MKQKRARVMFLAVLGVITVIMVVMAVDVFTEDGVCVRQWFGLCDGRARCHGRNQYTHATTERMRATIQQDWRDWYFGKARK